MINYIQPIDGCAVCKCLNIISVHKKQLLPRKLECGLSHTSITVGLYNAITNGATLINCPKKHNFN